MKINNYISDRPKNTARYNNITAYRRLRLSIVFPIFVHDALEIREHTLRLCISLIGISPPPGSPRAAPKVRDGSIINAPACHRLRHGCAVISSRHSGQVKACPLLCSYGLPVTRQQKECKGCAVLFCFQRTQRSILPSTILLYGFLHFERKNFLIFSKIFCLRQFNVFCGIPKYMAVSLSLLLCR